MTVIPILSLDLETTGLEPQFHAPWEIAWTTALHIPPLPDIYATHGGKPDKGELRIIRRRSFFLHVPVEARIDGSALTVGGFGARWERSLGWDWHEVFGRLTTDLDALRDDAFALAETVPPTHLVGAVPQFDHRMLERWLGWSHRLWHYHLIDVETLCAGKLGIPPPYDTDELTRRLLPGWDDSHKHEAAADVRWNLALYAAAYNLTIIEQEQP